MLFLCRICGKFKRPSPLSDHCFSRTIQSHIIHFTLPLMSPQRKTRTQKKNTKPRRGRALDWKRESCWSRWSKATTKKALSFANEYADFLSHHKTERAVVSFIRMQAENAGYVPLEEAEALLQKGERKLPKGVYAVNRNKTIVLARLGKRPLTEGARLILSHIDSPRLDLKVRPLYEDSEIAFLKTHYYGGIKKYHWPTIPLAMYGTIITKEGKRIEISIGDNEGDPVFTISDLLPHLGAKQMQKKMAEAVQAEELNLIAGVIPDTAEKENGKQVKMAVLSFLYNTYGITEHDFASADIEIVPAGKARDVGFDRGLLLGYGHDDRVCAYASLRAHLDQKNTAHAAITVYVDKEEIGSTSNTGATSLFFYDIIGRLLAIEQQTPFREERDAQIRPTLEKSKALSADVTAAYDPDYKEVFDPLNTARLSHGIAVEKYTGSRGKSFTSEAHAEYMAEIRNIFDSANVPWQTGGLGKVDVGGGGTIAMFLAEYNMDIVDCGLPVLSMHAPFEVVSKADLYAAYLGYRAFLKG